MQFHVQITAVSKSKIEQTMAVTTETSDSSEHFGSPTTPAVIPDGQGGSLTAVIGTRDPSADGSGQVVFFFHNNQFIGLNDTIEASQIKSLQPMYQNGFTITYANYGPTDPMYSPGLPPVTVSYVWNGTTMTASRALPTSVENQIQVTPLAMVVSSSHRNP